MKAAVLVLGLACGLGGCRKKPEDLALAPGGGWAVGAQGAVALVRPDGTFIEVEVETSEDLFAVSCRGAESVFAVGARGTFLRTFDGGSEWEAIDVGTRGTLRAVAAAARETVVVAGDEGLYLSADSGTTWSTLATGAFVDVVIDQAGEVILALDRQGALWREDRAASLRPVLAETGATALAASADAEHVAIIGPRAMLAVARHGRPWAQLAVEGTAELRAVHVDGRGAVTAVGADGVVVRVSPAQEVSVHRAGRSALGAVEIDGDGRGYAVGAGGVALATADGGRTWAVAPRPWPRVLGLDQCPVLRPDDPIGQ